MSVLCLCLALQPTDAPLPPKPPRKRHPSFDLQALLAPRRGTATPKPVESPVGGPSRNSPMSWLGRRALADPVITTSMAAAIPGWGGGGGGGVLIRGVEVSSKEVVDHTGSPRQHVLLGRTERDTGTDRTGSTAQRWICLFFFCFFLLFFIVLKGPSCVGTCVWEDKQEKAWELPNKNIINGSKRRPCWDQRVTWFIRSGIV